MGPELNHIKPYFLIPYIGLATISSIYCTYELFAHGFMSSWLGPLIIFLSFTIFMAIHMSNTIARTSESLWPVTSLSIIGIVLAMILVDPNTNALFFTIMGGVGNFLYVFWYSRNNRPENPSLSVGQFLPEFTLKTTDEQLMTSAFIHSKPALILFYRGNWCPLCMKQIAEIANIADDLRSSGINIYLIGAQSLDETRKIENQYSDSHMVFLYDPYFRAMDELNLLHLNGKPRGMLGFDRDTAYPTVLFVNKGGEILWSDLSDNYRLRPRPEVFLDLKTKFKMQSH